MHRPSVIDSDLLIAKIYARPPIWNRLDIRHSNRSIVERCWRDIVLEMRQDESSIRKKWKYLRDQYAMEMSRKHSKWPYLQTLMFLKDCVRIKPGRFHPQPAPFTRHELEHDVENDTMIYEGEDVLFQDGDSGDRSEDVNISDAIHRQQIDNSQIPTLPPVPTVSTRGSYIVSCQCKQQHLEIEKERLRMFKEKREISYDDDELFLLSLVPHLKKLPHRERMLLKTAMMKLVCDKVYGRQPENKFELV